MADFLENIEETNAEIGDTVEFLLYGKPRIGFITQATNELGDVPQWRIGFGDRDIEYVPKSDVLRVVYKFKK